MTGVFGIVTDGFGNVTGHFGEVARPVPRFVNGGRTVTTFGADVAYEQPAGHSLRPFKGRA